MANNHLEQMIAEWYDYKGYFVKRNVLVGPRPKGGYECELDVIAFHPGDPDPEHFRKPHVVHLEPSLDADSWVERERRFLKKFEAGRKYYRDVFKGLQMPDDIEQIAVLVFAARINHATIGGCRIMTPEELLEDIFTELKDKRLESKAIPEQLSILRSFQYVNQYRNAVLAAWNIPANAGTQSAKSAPKSVDSSIHR